MKKGINIWSFPTNMPIERCIRLAKDAGFDGIELALNESGPLSLESTKEEVANYRQIADDVGIELSSLATGLHWDYSITSNKKEVREKAKDIVKKQLGFASILGVDTILVVPGSVGVDFIPNAEVVSYDLAYERALETFSELADEAQDYGVTIGIENVWNKFLLSPLEMKSFIESVGSDYLGSYFDVGNVVYSGYPEQWIRILGKRIKKVHLKDYRRAVGGLSGFVDLLAGDVDYPEVIHALRAIGYDDYLTAEMIPAYTHYSEQMIYNTSASMDKILGRSGH